MSSRAPDVAAPRESEAQFTDWLVEAAKLHGWMVGHFRPARTTRGWRTPVQGDEGFPDVVLARDGVVLIAELKAARGRLRPGQQAWLAALGATAVVWRPSDRDEILRVLARPPATRST